MVQAYIRKVYVNKEVLYPLKLLSELLEGSCPPSIRQNSEYGGHVDLNRYWALSLLSRMNFVQRKATTAKSKYSVENFAEKKREFLDDLVATVQMENIPPELVLNWDQTTIKLVPSTSWTMNEQGARRVKLVDLNNKR